MSTYFTKYEPQRLETPSLTPENTSGSGKDSKNTTERAFENAEQEVTSGSDDIDKEVEIKQNSDAEDKHSESSASSETVNEDIVEDSPRQDSSTELVPDMENTRLPNGSVISEAKETSIPLIPSPKPSSSKASWRGLKRPLSKSSDDALTPVHTEARLSSADFNVAVVTYKRSTSQDYTKIDVHDHDDDDKDHSALYTDISTSWATSFWTQFSVLMVRTFKQSKPDILSKLNFVQVSR